MLINELERITNMSWDRYSCDDRVKKIWNEEEPFIGQSDVSSLIVNDFLGGNIFMLNDGHYYNTFKKDSIADLTYLVYSNHIPYYDGIIVSREELLNCNNVHERYLHLLKNVRDNFIKYGKKEYKLYGKDGEYLSKIPGTLGGHKKHKIYGKLDCVSALRYIENGKYVNNRVFFANEEDAIEAGFRPCSVCMRERYKEYKGNKLILKP